MARFAGSRAPQIGSLSGLGRSREAEFTPLNLDPGTSSAGSAAGAVSVGAIFGNLRDKSPKYDEIANTAQTIRANEQITAMKAEADMAAAGINAAETLLLQKSKPRHMKHRHLLLAKVEP